MRSLVTGGAGFIGSHLVDHLLEQGDEVVVLDDLSTGSLANLGQSRSDRGLRIVYGSVLDRPIVCSTIRKVDRVFHLAAAVGVSLILEHPLRSLDVNIDGTRTVMSECAEQGRPMLLASTSEVYGLNTADRLTEDSHRILGSPLVSRWTYAAAKGIDESYAHAYWRSRSLPVSIVRLFNTVGPRQTGRYGMVMPNLVAQALQSMPLTVYGDGTQTRCFTYVGDVVPALVRIIESPVTQGQALNLGGPEEISILDLAERILAVTGSSSHIELVPYDRAYAPGFEDMRRRVPDVTLAARLVGFAPTTPIDEMIAQVADDLIGSGLVTEPLRTRIDAVS